MSLAEYNAVRANVVPNSLENSLTDSETAIFNNTSEVQNAAHPARDLSLDLQISAITRIELVDITEKQKPYGEQPIISLTDSFHSSREDRGRYTEFAILIRRKIDKDGNAVSTEVEIRSPIIRRALQGILATYAFLNLAAVPIVIAKPYGALFHYRKEIREYTSAPERTSEETRHLRLLTDFLDKNIGASEKLYQQLNLNGVITFDLLWTLFRAEDDIVCQTDYFEQISRVVHCESKTTKDDEKFFQIQVWRWGYNAGKFGPAQETLVIKEFSSTRRITQLPFFPFRCLSDMDQKAMRTRLVGRGYQWRNLIHPEYRQYNGSFMKHPQ